MGVSGKQTLGMVRVISSGSAAPGLGCGQRGTAAPAKATTQAPGATP